MNAYIRLLIESGGVIALALVFYSYTYDWFPRGRRKTWRWRILLNGLAFGGLATILTELGIAITPDTFIDFRDILIALIGLFEGGLAALGAALIASSHRLWLGGAGAVPDVAGTIATALAAGGIHAWARGADRVGPAHALALSALVFAFNTVELVFEGRPGAEQLSRAWLPMLAAYLVGIGVVARLFHDVVEYRRLEGERVRFRELLDNSTDAVRIVEVETRRIVDCNTADCELFGHSREEMIGRSSRDFWPEEPELRARREATVAETLTQGFARSYALPYRTRSGKIISLDTTRRLVEHEGRRYFVIVLRDASERLAKEAAEKEVAELRSATLLARAAAHEVNNPLTALMGSLELLAGQIAMGDQEAKWVRRALDSATDIRDAIHRMNRITRIVATSAREGAPPLLDTEKSSAPEPERPDRGLGGSA